MRKYRVKTVNELEKEFGVLSSGYISCKDLLFIGDMYPIAGEEIPTGFAETVLESDYRGVPYSEIGGLRINSAMITPIFGTVKNIGKLRIIRKK